MGFPDLCELPSGKRLQKAIENGPVEIVDLSIKMMIFHSNVSLYSFEIVDISIKNNEAKGGVHWCWSHSSSRSGISIFITEEVSTGLKS